MEVLLLSMQINHLLHRKTVGLKFKLHLDGIIQH